MQLDLYCPASAAPFSVFLAFADLTHGLPNPSAWTAQLSSLFNADLDLPANMHMLDRAVGVGALLESVRVDVSKDGARVFCRLVDACTVEWAVSLDGDEEGRRFMNVFGEILKEVEALRSEEVKLEMAVEQERRSRHQPPLEPVSIGRKSTHKRQRSFLQSIVSAVGSMIQRPSSPSRSRSLLPTSYANDYPFPLTPSPSPPLSPPASPDPASVSSCTSVMNQHGHARTYTYGTRHSSPLPSPPSQTTQHQIRVKERQAVVRSGMINAYRRFILSALVYGYSKEVGLSSSSDDYSLSRSGRTSESQTLAGSPQSEQGTLVSGRFPDLPQPSAYDGPSRASNNAPNTYNYRLWVLRSMLRSAEAEVQEIIETCESTVKDDFIQRARTQANTLSRDEEDEEVDISDGNIDVSGLDAPESRRTSISARCTSATTSPRTKVSFDSVRSAPPKGEAAAMLGKSRSKGKLVKKKSLVWKISDGDKDKDSKETSQRNVLGIIGSWGRSKASLNLPSPVTPIPEDHVTETSEPANSASAASVESARNSNFCRDSSLLSPDARSYASRRESSSSSGCTSLSMATMESVDTAQTTPAGSVVDLPKCDEEEEELDIVEHDGAPSRSRSTLNILEQLNTAGTSSSSLLIPLDNETADTSARSLLSIAEGPTSPLIMIPDVNTPEFQLELSMRLNLHPAYTRLTHRVHNLREYLAYAEGERRDAREEEERYLDVLEVRSRRKAWSNGALGRSACPTTHDCDTYMSRRVPGGSRCNPNSDLMLLGLAAPFKPSGLAISQTSEDLEKEGWVYVAPQTPHFLFHGAVNQTRFQGVGAMAFPKMFAGGPLGMEGEGSSLGVRMMRKVDIRMRMEREKRRRMEMDGEDSGAGSGVGDCDDVFGRRRQSDEEEDDGLGFDESGADAEAGRVVEFCLNAAWNTGASLEDSELELERNVDEAIFGVEKRGDSHGLGQHSAAILEVEDMDEDDRQGYLNDLANIPPRPGVRPAKTHPPPARLSAVAEEHEVDDIDAGPNSAGTATETETEGETEGEGDEFEFDNITVSRAPSRRLAIRAFGNDDVSDGEDDSSFVADIHDITEFVGDIEDGLGRHQRYTHHRPPRPSRFSAHLQRGSSSSSSGQTSDGQGHPHLHHRTPRRSHAEIDMLEDIGCDAPPYPLESFDVDVEMGLGVGQGVRGSSLEFQQPEEAGLMGDRDRLVRKKKAKSVKGRPRTPYPQDESAGASNDGEGDSQHGEGEGGKKRQRNHRRQWQNMLSGGRREHQDHHEDNHGEVNVGDGSSSGIEIALEVEKPKPRFMPAMKKAIMGRGSSSKVRRTAEPTVPDPGASLMAHTKDAPRARTSSMYNRDSTSQTSAQGAIAPVGAAAAGPVGRGLPLGLGYGYGTYTNTPEKELSDSSLLCQPVRFSAAAPTVGHPASSLATKSLVASPPPSFYPEQSHATSKVWKHPRQAPCPLDLVDGGAAVEHSEEASLESACESSDGDWSPCSHVCGSACSSASLPMSPISPPSPIQSEIILSSSCSSSSSSLSTLVGGASVTPAVSSLPSLDAVGSTCSSSSSLSTLVGGQGLKDGEKKECNAAAMDFADAQGKRRFHLPLSPSVLKDGPVDVGLAIGNDPSGVSKSKKVRPSVLEDPAFFEPPAVETELVAVKQL